MGLEDRDWFNAGRKARLEIHAAANPRPASRSTGPRHRRLAMRSALVTGVVVVGLTAFWLRDGRILGRASNGALGVLTAEADDAERTAPWPFPPESAEMRHQPRTANPSGPLVIVAPRLTSERHYAIRVRDWYTGAAVTTLYMRSSEVMNAELSAGAYRLTFAEGVGWKGHDRLFGTTTQVTQGEQPIVIAPGNGTMVGIKLVMDESLAGNFRRHPAS